jgi:hypothetical protein
MDPDKAFLRRSAALDHGDLPGQDDEKVAVSLALAEEDLLRLDGAAPARFGQRRELGIVQAGIGPLEIGCLLEVLGGLGNHARAGMLVTRP